MNRVEHQNEKKQLEQIFFYIAKSHPEFYAQISKDDQVLQHFKKDFDFHLSAYYDKRSDCELAQLCDKYGSDKGEITSLGHPYSWGSHTYTDYYRRLWGHCRGQVKMVFECGLGTNNPNIKSSMGINGKPGASLRVWRDYFPNAEIFGGDIDENSDVAL